MCGIAGYAGPVPPERGRTLLAAMNKSLAHRGPDGEGLWVDDGIGLAQRRLAVIDIAGGAQPMASLDGRYEIICNGEIYNHNHLRQQLQASGYRFRSRSDTEVIPAAIDHWGVPEGLLKLRGMFAFALYDTREHRLLLARDPVGIKPFYVARSGNLTLFASELKAILTTGLVSRRWNPVAVLDFFTVGATLSPHTCFSAMSELLPGTWLSLTADGEQHGRYWSWPTARATQWSEAEAVDRLEAVLTDSLRAHLESDVAVAAFLSGGIDSSVLVSLLRQRLHEPIRSFTVGFDEPAYDESRHARAVAANCGSDHEEFRIPTGSGNPELLRQIVEQYDQPFGDSSCIPTWLICREMARKNKVVISGDGGDEMFGGYERYQTARDLAALHRRPLARHAVAAAGAALSRTNDIGRMLTKASCFAALPRNQMFCSLHTYFTEPEIRSLVSPQWVPAMIAEGRTFTRFPGKVIDDTDPADQLMAAEIRSTLHADYLRKVDVASSAHGLEVRTPYLDAEVFAFASSLPLELKVRRNSLKHVLRLLAKRWIPLSAVNRRKQGFGIPFDHWAGPQMREFIRDLLLGGGACCHHCLQLSEIRRLIAAFFDGAAIPGISRYQVYQRVFMLLSFELWLRKWSPELS